MDFGTHVCGSRPLFPFFSLSSPLPVRHIPLTPLQGSRIGFATVSNFLMLLLVQAPNSAHASRAKHLVESWLQVLRCQSQCFPLVKLGLARLDALQWAGLDATFVLPPHVQEVIGTTGNF